MKVTAVEATTLVIPLERAMGFATRTVGERHYTLVRVRTEDGTEGYGWCYGGHKAGNLVTLAVRELLRDVVVGRDSNDTEAIWDAMFRESLLHGRRGSVMRAISAIDIALWDANARRAGLPLWRYLGGYYEKGVVPAYASGGYYTEGKSPEDLAREMERYLEMGLRAVKMKVGRVSPQEDARRIEAVRKTVGPDVPVFLDANNAWDDLPTALHALRLWEEYEPGWIEEPFMPDEIDLHAQLAMRTEIPVATGEIENGRWGFRALLESHGADYIQADAGVCGGITEWRKIGSMAQAYGVQMAPHWFADLHVHLVASTPNATWVEFFPDDSVLNLRRVFARQLEVRDGGLALPDAPGLGVEWDWDAVNHYSVDGFC